MANPRRQSMPPRMITPLRLDSTIMLRGNPEMSPSRSSIQSSDASRVHTPSSSVPNTPLTSARPSSPEKKLPRPGETNTFLTALAAQERRVLELKEELQKAEVELEKLKKQWASLEATKKRNELRHLEQLQPLMTSLANHLASQDDVQRVNKELDRRKRTSSSVKATQRTVFSGSRHTRTLSLLSPKESAARSQPMSQGNGPAKPRLETVNDVAVPLTIHELSTSTDGSSIVTEHYKGPSREVILETGKQLVGDFRQGLWTFFDDLRQVTVGDEAARTPDSRDQSSLHPGNLAKRQGPRENGSNAKSSTTRSADNLKDLANLRPEHSTRVSVSRVDDQAAWPKITPAPSHFPTTESDPLRNTNNSSSDTNDDGWDNWETSSTKGSTPRRKDALYVADPMASPLTDKSSPRTSMSSLDATTRSDNASTFTEKRKDIPWPALKKLSPSRLSRTASTLMAEWEKSLTPHTSKGTDSPLKIEPKEQKAD